MPAAAETSKSRDVKHLVEDEDPSTLAKVRAELAKSRQENARLKANLEALEGENSGLKNQLVERDSELKDTQAMLGQLVVTFKRQGQSNPSTAGPSRRPEPSLTRPRSSSPEIVEIPEPPRKKQKKTETFDVPPATTKTRNLAFVSILQRNSSGSPKAERSSQPQTSIVSRPKPASNAVVYISTASSTSSAIPSNLKRFQPRPNRSPSPTPKVVKSSPSEMKRRIKLEKLTPRSKNAKVKVAREDEESASGTDSSTSSVATGNLSPKEDKPKTSIKIKTKDVFILPDATVRRYLQSARTLKVTPPPLDLQVPRMFLRLAYGGSDQQFLQIIQSDMNPSGPVQRRIVFPMLDMNPAMPNRPGEPGLVFASRHEILSNPPWTLFCKLSNAAPAVWLYLGEYESVLCGKMTATQFKSQTLVVKKEWAKLILKTKAFDVYVSMRARIALRLAGTIPVEDKEDEEDLVNAEMRAVKNDKGLPVTEEEVITAFSNGDEGIDIIRMTCVKYDHAFANDMKAKFANYATLLAANKRKKEKEKVDAAKNKTNPKKPGRKPKAQAQAQPHSLESEDADESDVDVPVNSDEEYVVPTGDGAGPSTSVSTTLGLRPRRPSQKSVSVAGYFEECFGGALTEDEED